MDNRLHTPEYNNQPMWSFMMKCSIGTLCCSGFDSIAVILRT